MYTYDHSYIIYIIYIYKYMYTYDHPYTQAFFILRTDFRVAHMQNQILPKLPTQLMISRAVQFQLRDGRSWDRIQLRARFSAPVKTGPGAHPASYTMGTGSFPGVKSDQGVELTTHPHPSTRLKKEQRYTATSSLGFRGLFQVDLYLYLTLKVF